MNILLDTHALIWFINGDEKLSANARALIADGSNQVYFSVISSFEMAVKINIGKLKLSQPLTHFLQIAFATNLQVLPIKDSHLLHYTSLPFPDDHRDRLTGC